ncbi:MAG: M48 family metallopeptidase [Verrucomicrobiae bacterium]|nr:M48 family metallopeptidase [Verrucomicrobiae bacterium]
MNFFEHQDRARRRTGVLLVYFGMAVAGTILCVYLLFAAVIGIAEADRARDLAIATGMPVNENPLAWLWNPVILLWSVVGAGGLILCGSLFKVAMLASGGKSVAEMLGGELVDVNTRSPDERKLLNVVEEMAIASGTPVPPVYILNDNGINAFAAGFSPRDAVIGVTRGTIRNLTRDELQGVIAHEFSHIFNGDMRLNIRIIGLLHGILLIALVGYWVIRIFAQSRSGGGKKNNTMAFVLIGFGLLIIGYVGVFFANLIRSAISRQREFLADASAVQFTRNPAGIAGALKKIAAGTGSKLESPHAGEAAHLFFADGICDFMSSIFATHPPLPQRIQAIEGKWSEFRDDPAKPRPVETPASTPARPAIPAIGGLGGALGFAAAATPATPPAPPQNVPASPVPPPAVPKPAAAAATVGQAGHGHIQFARHALEAIPETLRQAAREAFSARAVMVNVLLSDDEDHRQRQMEIVGRFADASLMTQIVRLGEPVRSLDPMYRIPLIDFCLPGLRYLAPAQYVTFRELVKQLISSDGQVELFEYAVQRIMIRHLDMHFGMAKPSKVRFRKLDEIRPQLEILLSALAYVGVGDGEAAQACFQAGSAAFPAGSFGQPLALQPLASCHLGAIEETLNGLSGLAPILKESVLNACEAAVMSDLELNVSEAELLRAVADSLDCPLPPLLRGEQFQQAA